ncbi:hypothetical protein F441_17757 [Phytophthora nicotianae CJ01A1]|uniref:Fe2OG dioxygenase domain-containing protein n=3 Tax=Phytophthora nicotianae TaxID=4792 RepID=V9E9Z4_PHYNI|nr:hypothetical protein F443_17883 [Phytophthora nicotianae P1569]ETK76104.1 hypothetical protein L915_17409 [Phytophthora nicotianae]ETL29542.1 hypothetical protein L916_17302 [Phytophthora nicotianae]ETM36009.1 hypothetical protein L914_17201 [Phytophthora nicotianae]ETP05735.1 hypothetical protein F441_17757 [Phytophthora nicotianae CJ01A1]
MYTYIEGDENDFKEGVWPFGSEGDPDDAPIPSGGGCRQINKVLARADEDEGEFSFGGPAYTLPSAPGLFVGGVGHVPVPVCSEQTQQLIARCEKSPFGHNLDTKKDENAGKSWHLQPDLVQLQNPLWEKGLKQLTDTISHRLGYEDVSLQRVLCGLVLYDEGEHIVKHRDTKKENVSLATLVIQLPSLHEGGGLVVNRGDERYHYDLGKADGMSPFLAHYAVYYADAECSIDKITKGYCPFLVYSLYVPLTVRHLERDGSITEELVKAIESMNPEEDDESFALLLGDGYTEKCIASLGFVALKGLDRARLGVVLRANAVVSPEKKLKLFIAQLSHDISYFGSFGEQHINKRMNSIKWYSLAGEYLGNIRNLKSASLNFLNPGQETLWELWMPHGMFKEENTLESRVYSRYAVIAWPVAKHTENVLKLMPEDVAIEKLYAHSSGDATVLRTFLQDLRARFEDQKDFSWESESDIVSVRFCRTVCKLLVDAGDPDLVNFFFSELCPDLDGLEGNEILIPSIILIVRTFDWRSIGDVLLKVLGKHVHRYGNDEAVGALHLELALDVMNALDNGTAKNALLKLAVQEAAKFAHDELCCDEMVEIIWKHAIHCEINTVFTDVVNMFKETDARLLRRTVKTIVQSFDEIDEGNERYSLLTSLVVKRVGWLKKQIEAYDRPFSWEMPDAEFADNSTVQQFLRGPDVTMRMTRDIYKFKGFKDARNHAAEWTRKNQVNASFEMEASSTNGNAVVAITKTRKWFTKGQQNLERYKKELSQLKKHNSCKSGDPSDVKRARVE